MTDSNANPSARKPAMPLAIIGIGCLFPKADNLGAFWANIRDGVDAITEIPKTHWNPADYFDEDKTASDKTYAQRGGFLNPYEFDPLAFGISPNNIEATDTTQLLGMVAAGRALLDAGYDEKTGKPFDRDRTSVILGVTGTLELVIPLGARLGHPLWRKALDEAGVDKQTADDVVQRIADGYVPWQENSFPGLLGNVAAGRIANRFDLGGTNCVVDAACASSLSAIHLASMELQAGRSDMVIAGGLDTFNDIFMYMCFSKTPAMSPTGNARPFSAGADGTILGEGLGVVILKRLEDAQHDGDSIYATIEGIGTSSDGRGNAIYAPSSQGQAKAIQDAYRQASVSPRDIELVEAHGTGTKAGDAVELEALTELYQQADVPTDGCALGSIKSMIGHTKAAAGVAGLIKAAMALHTKVLPPTIKVDQPAESVRPHTSPLYVNTVKRPWVKRAGAQPRRAAVSAFGFGGSNYHAVLGEAPNVEKAIDWDGRIQLWTLSGDSITQLQDAVAKIDSVASWDVLRAEAAASRECFDPTANCRLTLVIEQHKTDLAKLLGSARKMFQRQPDADRWQTPDGAFFATGQPAGKVGILFPGQGAQQVGMLRDLACQFPQMLSMLDRGNDAFGATLPGHRLSDHIYPVPVFNEADEQQQNELLRQTQVAQPAIAAMSLGVWRVLEYFGLKTDVTAGHSLGELVALCAAGRLGEAEMLAVVCARGRLMAQQKGGAMLAVAAEPEALKPWLDKFEGLVLANHNSPTQVVLSGPVEAIDQIAVELKAQKIRVKKLAVSAAFHSPLVAAAAEPFAKALEKVSFTPSQIPVYANTTAEVYPQDAEACRALLANQLAKPVRFATLIENLHKAGVRTFIELGPNRHVTGMVRATLAEAPHVALALDRGNGQADLARLLGELASLGHPLNLKKWDENSPKPIQHAKRMTITLTGANYVKPKPSRPRTKHASKDVRGHETPTQKTPTRSTVVTHSPPPPGSPGSFSQEVPQAPPQALAFAQQSIVALQKLQEQTAQLHQQYLHGQQAAQQTLEQLISQQMQLFGAGAIAPASIPMTPPPPIPPVSPAPPVPPVATVLPTSTVAPPAPVAMPKTRQEKLSGELPGADPGRAGVQQVLLEVVSEKTGYPTEMLELDMSLDADLGIDSIKRVEILSALQEKLPDAPQVKPDDLGTLQTLRQIVEFLGQAEEPVAELFVASSDPAVAPPVSGGEQGALPGANPGAGVQQVLLEVVSDKTGYPTEMLELDMSLDADLGIDSIKRVEILSALQEKLPDAPQVKPDDLGTLQTLRQIVEFLGGTDRPFPQASLGQPTETDSVDVVAAQTLDRQILVRRPLNETGRDKVHLSDGARVLVAHDGRELTCACVVAMVEQLKGRGFDAKAVSLGEPVESEGVEALILAGSDPLGAFKLMQQLGSKLRLLVGITFLDGAFGLSKVHDPQTAALSGLVKTASHEWPEVTCRVLDVDPDSRDHADANAMVEELLYDGPLEVALNATGGTTLGLEAIALEDEGAGSLPLSSEDTVVVTGGARGVTAEIAVELARVYHCHLLLLGRSPVPQTEPHWLSGLTDEAAIKRALLTHGQGQTPKAIAEACRAWLANREILQTLARIEAAGGRGTYVSADVCDEQAMLDAISQARSKGAIAGLIHGAGVLADRLIEDKTDAQFDQVFSTKVDGFEHLLTATEEDHLKVIVVFSSSTGRFGRKGQVDYAAANEVLNKMAQHESHTRPGCRVLSINWGPWDGGMVTPALKQMFAAEGINVIPLDSGAQYLAKEIATPLGGPVEIVILGPREKSKPVEASATPGENFSLAFERTVSLDTLPILSSHVLDGKAVLPAAMMIEWIAHVAMSENPGMVLAGLDQFSVYKGVIVPSDQAAEVQILTAPPIFEGDREHVAVEIRSGKILHARATVVLAHSLESASPSEQPRPQEAYQVDVGRVYAEGLLFHGPALEAIERVDACDAAGIVGQVKTSPAPRDWLTQPIRNTWLTDPLALDAVFQLLILWSHDQRGNPSLPTGIERYRQYTDRFPSDGVTLVCRVRQQSEHQAVTDVEMLDQNGKLMATLTGYACVIDASLKGAFKNNQLQVQV